MGTDWDKEFMIKLAVTFAMDRKASQRELTSRLISDLYGEHVLDQNAIAKGITAHPIYLRFFVVDML